MRLAPAVPVTVDGLELTEAQAARLSRLVLCIWSRQPHRTAEGVVDYACDCFRVTVRRDGDAFVDRLRVSVGGRSFAVV